MTTQGQGTLLVNAYGSIKKIELNNQEITIDNAHVVAWSQSLDYNIHLENVSGNPSERVKVLSIPLEGLVRSMFKVSTFRPLLAC